MQLFNNTNKVNIIGEIWVKLNMKIYFFPMVRTKLRHPFQMAVKSATISAANFKDEHAHRH